MRRLAVSLLVAAALAAGCGGAEEDAPAPRATTGPTEAELAFREEIIEEIKRGEYKCHCTAAMRARERIEKGLADAP